MKAVFFKCSIPIEVTSLNEEGQIVTETIMRNMEQGEVVDVISYSENSLMELAEGVWWLPDKNLFNLVGIAPPIQSCCGG